MNHKLLCPKPYKRAARQDIMIPRSMASDKKNVGTVTLVGKAARLVINDIPMAAIAKAIATGLFPVAVMTNSVRGVKKHPCANRITASQTKRFSFWSLAQVINRANNEGLLIDGE
jgi:hypothetical protein